MKCPVVCIREFSLRINCHCCGHIPKKSRIGFVKCDRGFVGHVAQVFATDGSISVTVPVNSSSGNASSLMLTKSPMETFATSISARSLVFTCQRSILPRKATGTPALTVSPTDRSRLRMVAANGARSWECCQRGAGGIEIGQGRFKLGAGDRHLFSIFSSGQVIKFCLCMLSTFAFAVSTFASSSVHWMALR